ncbi:MAG: Crp/Fnr family transcriptional regulator [Chitinophagaceae bacterium]|nr:Crp/Fnr family transcriptional regulator [Chitinophagaceae bacterium]
MEDNLLQIKNVIERIHPLSQPAWEAFSSIWTAFSARRKEMITTAGEKEKYLYIVLEGVQRVVYFDEQNREATLLFTYPPSFGGVLDSFLTRSASRYYYETLTPSSFLRTPYAELEKLMTAYPDIELLIRKGITGVLAGLLERLTELQCFSSEEKFRKLLERSPHILQLVPHKYLANYLGIDATNFSKMINRIKI